MTIPSTLALRLKGLPLDRIGLDLIEDDETCECWAYGTFSFIDWYDGSLPYLTGSGASELSPDEEVDHFLRRFQLGKPVCEFARLQPTRDGVWEIRLEHTRLFGWFVQENALILVNGADLGDVKNSTGRGYAAFFREVKKQRKVMGLGYVAGDLRAVRVKG